MIQRILKDKIKNIVLLNKVILLTGPRRVGKRAIVESVLNELGESPTFFDVSEKKLSKEFHEADLARFQQLFGASKFVVIQEAQYLSNLQLLIEHVLSGELTATMVLCCSYQPLLDEVLREVLVLQDLEIPFLPLTFNEMARNTSLSEEESLLEKRLIYGSYPEIVSDLEYAEPKLREIVQEAIFTNLGVTDRINKGDKLMRMLQALSFRIGESVSYNEIAEKSGLDNETVERYIELLEKSFILVKLPVYYHGHRYEMKKSHVVYFLDNGIRNVLINNFNPLFLRNDVDQLWRNWLISERIKWVRMSGRLTDFYFWRTHTRQTIDLIEVHNDAANAYKTAWEKKKKIKFPAAFKEAYPQIATHTLNKSTFLGFLTKK